MAPFKKLRDRLRGYPADIQLPNGIWQCMGCKKHFPPRTRLDIFVDYHTHPAAPAALITRSGIGTCPACAKKHQARAGSSTRSGETLYLLSAAQLWQHVSDPPDYTFQASRSKARQFAETYVAHGRDLLMHYHKPSAAAEAFRRATAIDPRFYWGWYALMDTYREQQNAEGMIATCTDALRHLPTIGDFYVWRGVGKYVKASKERVPHTAVAILQAAQMDLTSGIRLGPAPDLLALPDVDARVIQVDWERKLMMIQAMLEGARVDRNLHNQRMRDLTATMGIERDLRDIKNKLNRL